MALAELAQTPSAPAKNFQSNLMSGRNDGNAPFDAMDVRPVEYYLYLFTVNKNAFTRPSVPGLYPKTLIPACKPEERFKKVCRFAHPMAQVDPDPDNPGKKKITYSDGRRVAMDFCNPANVTLDQDNGMNTEAERWVNVGSGMNFSQQGVFFSRNENPTDEELAAAERRLRNYYRTILERVDGIPDTDPSKQGQITQDHHAACEMFGEERPWHRTFTQKETCENCGTKVPKGIAFHRDNGVLCVRDWKRAVNAGVVKKDDVPDDMRWWARPGRPPKQHEVQE